MFNKLLRAYQREIDQNFCNPSNPITLLFNNVMNFLQDLRGN